MGKKGSGGGCKADLRSGSKDGHEDGLGGSNDNAGGGERRVVPSVAGKGKELAGEVEEWKDCVDEESESMVLGVDPNVYKLLGGGDAAWPSLPAADGRPTMGGVVLDMSVLEESGVKDKVPANLLSDVVGSAEGGEAMEEGEVAGGTDLEFAGKLGGQSEEVVAAGEKGLFFWWRFLWHAIPTFEWLGARGLRSEAVCFWGC